MRRNSQKMFLGIEIEGWKQVQWWTEIPVFILFQVLIAVPLIGFVNQNIHQYPPHIYPLLYVMVLLIPPVGIVADVCIFVFYTSSLSGFRCVLIVLVWVYPRCAPFAHAISFIGSVVLGWDDGWFTSEYVFLRTADHA